MEGNSNDYTFDNLATHVEGLLFGVLGLKQFSIYVQDYGAPVGFRIASKHSEAIAGIVVQNGNASSNESKNFLAEWRAMSNGAEASRLN